MAVVCCACQILKQHSDLILGRLAVDQMLNDDLRTVVLATHMS